MCFSPLAVLTPSISKSDIECLCILILYYGDDISSNRHFISILGFYFTAIHKNDKKIILFSKSGSILKYSRSFRETADLNLDHTYYMLLCIMR